MNVMYVISSLNSQLSALSSRIRCQVSGANASVSVSVSVSVSELE